MGKREIPGRQSNKKKKCHGSTKWSIWKSTKSGITGVLEKEGAGKWN